MAWFNMNQNFGKHFDDGKGFLYNDVLFNQKDILEQVEMVMEIIEKEVNYYPDKNLGRIFIGGLSMGGSLAISCYLRYTEKVHLGGIVSMYGINPLSMESTEATEFETYIRS
jgi:predicted esterase